jgi:chemotaxis protein MotB
MAKDDDKRPVIIIKRVKKSGGGHHGGAWKVAYADFVTAMMAFFLLLWLLNVTTKDQRDAISSYFRPADPMIAESTSGAGGVMGGQTMSDEGAMTDDKTPVSQQRTPAEGVGREDGQDGVDPARLTEKEIDAELERRDNEAFKDTEEKLREAIESVPDLRELAQNLLVDMTPEGLRIQIVDQEGKPMFELGSARPMPQAEKLLRVIAQVVRDLPNKLSVRGHTDSKPYGRDVSYGNWELSADRANASRRVMLGSALDPARIENIQGKADREHLVPDDPENARNRRISIILLKQSIAPATPRPQAKEPPAPAPKKDAPQGRRREDGVIYFP